MANKSIEMFQVAVLWLVFIASSVVVVATSLAEQPFRPFETTLCEERQTAGLICYSCSVLATCVRINSLWTTVPVAECDNSVGMYCNVREGGCSSLAGPCNNIGHKQNFVCSSIGIFPDPYDCQRYHFCQQSGNSLGAINVECGGNSAYNPMTGQCSLTLDDDICQSDQYVCDHVGQQAAWPGNDNIFYICKAELVNGNETYLYPALYRCAPEEIFNGSLCVARGGSSTVTPPTGTPTYDCPAYGVYPLPDDCNSYFFCNINLLPTIYRCPEETYFDKVLQGCVRGNCTN